MKRNEKITYVAAWLVFLVVLVTLYRRHPISLRRDLPIYTCTTTFGMEMGEKAQCDFETYTSEMQEVGQQYMMETFRSCSRLYVQGEAESWVDFIKRVPHKQACWLMRKSVQPSGRVFPEDAYALQIIGGSFKN